MAPASCGCRGRSPTRSSSSPASISGLGRRMRAPTRSRLVRWGSRSDRRACACDFLAPACGRGPRPDIPPPLGEGQGGGTRLSQSDQAPDHAAAPDHRARGHDRCGAGLAGNVAHADRACRRRLSSAGWLGGRHRVDHATGDRAVRGRVLLDATAFLVAGLAPAAAVSRGGRADAAGRRQRRRNTPVDRRVLAGLAGCQPRSRALVWPGLPGWCAAPRRHDSLDGVARSQRRGPALGLPSISLFAGVSGCHLCAGRGRRRFVTLNATIQTRAYPGLPWSLRVKILAVLLLAFAVIVLVGVELLSRPASINVTVQGGRASVGALAPDFTTQTIDGTPVHLRQYRGKPVLLN